MNHRVHAGETLTKIAARYGTTVEALAHANKLRDPDRISKNQILRIPTPEQKSASIREKFGQKKDLKEKFGIDRKPTQSAPALTRAPTQTQSSPAAAATETERPEPATTGGSSVHVKVPYYSQFEGGHGFKTGKKSCYLASAAMARDSGVKVLGPGARIQVATSEHRDGSIEVSAKNAAKGREYIDGQLAHGRPVVVGVSHKDAKYNVDGITDHFVVITGRGKDAQGRTYYTFHDPGTRNAALGRDTNPNNRFHVDRDDGMLYRDGLNGKGLVTQREYGVAMVRKNA